MEDVKIQNLERILYRLSVHPVFRYDDSSFACCHRVVTECGDHGKERTDTDDGLLQRLFAVVGRCLGSSGLVWNCDVATQAAVTAAVRVSSDRPVFRW